ncbi:MAG: dihydroorotase [Cyanobacteria bacterium J069]|nr:MAG: dihydroorotase [Cyanobacteria bacterium J069]
MASELFRQVRLLDPVSETDRVVDVWIEAGGVRAIREAAPTGIAERLNPSDSDCDVTVTDGAGLVLGPGLVDLYSHSGEPGYESRETLASLHQAARAGGFVRVLLLPDTAPAIATPADVDWIGQHAPAGLPRLQPWGALTRDAKGDQMTELGELANTGIAGFADGRPIRHWGLLRRSLEYAQALNRPIALWCCDETLRGNGVMRDGPDAIRFGLPGAPAIAETAPLAALLECVAQIGTPVHLMRVSTARSVELIAQAKASGLPITASTTWHHLLLNTQAVGSYDPNLRLEPPLGTPADQAALIEAVRDGVLEAIAIDHSPYTYEEKTVPFAEAPPGAIGLELALPLLWQQLVEPGHLSALTLWRALSTNPLRCLAEEPAAITPDTPANLTLFDPRPLWKVTGQSLQSRAANTPWLGEEIQGRVVQVIGSR